MSLERTRGLKARNLIVKLNASEENGRPLYNTHMVMFDRIGKAKSVMAFGKQVCYTKEIN